MDYVIAAEDFDYESCAALVTQIWADLAFDGDARAALKRDGLALKGLRLTGPMPYIFKQNGDNSISVSAKNPAHEDALLDLFRLAILPRLRSASA